MEKRNKSSKLLDQTITVLIMLSIVGYLYSIFAYNEVGVAIFACLAGLFTLYFLGRNIYNRKYSTPIFVEKDEDFLEDIQEVKLRINLILVETRGIAEVKGIDEERLNFHCAYLTGGKGLFELDLNEVVLFRSYILGLNELRDIKTERKLALNSMAEAAKLKAKEKDMDDKEFSRVVSDLFNGETIDNLNEYNLKILINYIDNSYLNC